MPGARSTAMTPGRQRGAAAACLCIALAVYLGLAQRDESRLEDANRLGLSGDLRGAVRAAGEVGDGPARARADAVAAYALAAQGRSADAVPAFSRALRHAPNDWALHRDYGQVLLRLGLREKAQARMRRALALNPRMTLPPGFVDVTSP